MDYFIAVSLSFFFTFITIPIVINVFNSIDLLDIPNRRKVHKVGTPSMGGIAFIGSLLITLIFVFPISDLADLKFLIAGLTIIFVLGIRDDISSLDAKQKVVVQLLASIIVVEYSGIYLQDIQGFMGIYELSPIIGKGLTVFIIIALTNSFNLIDGIDGLAGGISLVALLFLGINFFHSGNYTLSLIAITLASGIIAFLYFNWYPSKIFMGDTGSMSLGFVLSIFLVSFINISNPILAEDISAPIAIAISMLIVPVYDTLRVMIKRLLGRKSPFKPDKNHIHHILLKVGFSHGQAAMLLIGFTFTMICFSMIFQSLGNNWLVIIQLITISSLGWLVDATLSRKIKSFQQNKRIKSSVA